MGSRVIDVSVETHGTIALLRGCTAAGREWLDEHVAFEQFFGNAGVAEPRYVSPIIEGVINAGLQVEVV
jgi:hypothetical protein